MRSDVPLHHVPGTRAQDRAADVALYSRLTGYFTQTELDGVKVLAERVIDAAGGTSRLGQYKVLVAYGGGKDSSYVVALVRAVQLHLQITFDSTFVMRVANMRHAGVTSAVMENIDRVYGALDLLTDERAELLTVDHSQVRPFRRDLPFPESLRAINRLDVLMNGHRSAGDGRPTFCNSCNLAVADLYGRAAWWQGGVDAVMTGDSRRELALYSSWIMRLAKDSGIDVAQCRRMGFQGLLTALRGIGDVYFRELFGDDSAAELAEREVSIGDRSVQPAFISIYDVVSYRVDDHWDLIVDFLGFEFDELAFSFSESDCANPSLMAHLRGLRAQFVQGRSYADGIAEYLTLAEFLMRKKEMPENLIELAMGRYDSPAKIEERRRLVSSFAVDAFGLQESALVAMVFSPFTDQGERLGEFLDRCRPEMASQEPALRAVLGGAERADGVDEAALISWLEAESGLSITQLRRLYRSAVVDFGSAKSMISRVRLGDPHKNQVQTLDLRTGEPMVELVSGR